MELTSSASRWYFFPILRHLEKERKKHDWSWKHFGSEGGEVFGKF